MTATEMHATIDEIDEGLRQARLSADLARTRLNRYTHQAFEDGNRAFGMIASIMTARGGETAITALNGSQQCWYFGYQRHPFMGFGKSRNPDVRAALAALPDEIRNLERAEAQIRDLSALKREQVISHEPTQTRQPTVDRQRSRTRSRS